MTIDSEMVNRTVEVITALLARCIKKTRERNCEGCIRGLSAATDHMCAIQLPAESVEQYFEDAFQSIGVNIINAVFVMDGEVPPNIDVSCVKMHFKEEIRSHLHGNLDTLTNGDLRVARCIVYMQPLFKSIL